MDRRQFLRGLVAGSACCGFARIVSPSVLLAQSPAPGTPKNLVVLNLGGGIDGLFAFPYTNSLYTTVNSLRGPIAVTSGILPVNSAIGLHPNWAPMQFAHQSGFMKMIQSVGFVGNSERSHDNATRQVHSLDPLAGGSAGGVLGNVTSSYPNNFGPYTVWSIRGGGGFIFKPSTISALEVDSLSSFSYRAGPFTTTESNNLRVAAKELLDIAPDPRYDTPLRDKIVSVAKQSHAAVPVIASIRNVALTGNYGTNNRLGDTFKDIVKVIKYNHAQATGQHVIAFTHYGGFDSHNNQLSSIPGAISNMANALAGAIQDLQQAAEIWNNTLILVISEFGRTTKTNHSDPSIAGTDHGGANTTIAFGGSVNGGSNVLAGPFPTAAELSHDRNYLEPKLDWRNVFGEVFNWMGFDPNLVIPGGYTVPSDPTLRPNLFV